MTTQKRKRNSRRRRSRESTLPKIEYPSYDCAICGKPIKELSSAIAEKENGAPSHFDCILKKLAESEELTPNDKVCYLGKGSFGIIAFRNSSSPIRFLIKKRIQFEEFQDNPEWRKQMAVIVKPAPGPRSNKKKSPNSPASNGNKNSVPRQKMPQGGGKQGQAQGNRNNDNQGGRNSNQNSRNNTPQGSNGRNGQTSRGNSNQDRNRRKRASSNQGGRSGRNPQGRSRTTSQGRNNNHR